MIYIYICAHDTAATHTHAHTLILKLTVHPDLEGQLLDDNHSLCEREM